MKKRKETVAEFEVIFEPLAEGGYMATVPKLPGLVTEGDSLKEAREMAKDAILCYIEGLLKDVASAVPGKLRKREKLVLTF